MQHSDFLYTPLLNLSRKVLACHRPRLIPVDIIYAGMIQEYFRKHYFRKYHFRKYYFRKHSFVDKLSKDSRLIVF